MVRLMIRHRVEDYSAWRRGYDEFSSEREQLGVRDDAVFQSVDDPNEVTVWHDFDSTAKGHEFTESPQLREAMANAGVVGQPQMWFVNPV